MTNSPHERGISDSSPGLYPRTDLLSNGPGRVRKARPGRRSQETDDNKANAAHNDKWGRGDGVVCRPCGCVVVDLLLLGGIFVGPAGPDRGVTACECSKEL